MLQLLKALQAEALPAVWTQGAKLAESDAVTVIEQSPQEFVARVRVHGQPVAPTVVLYPQDSEWACDCGGNVDPCAHAVAAAKAIERAKRLGEPLNVVPATVARLNYHFSTTDSGGLRLTRTIVDRAGHSQPLQQPLAKLMARGQAPEGLSPTHRDLDIDQLLSIGPAGDLSAPKLKKLLGLLSETEEVTLDGAKVKASGERLPPRAVVRDVGSDVLLRIEAHPSLERVVTAGVGLSGGTLRPLGETQLAGEKLERLPLDRRFSEQQLGELVTEVLPEIEAKFELVVETNRLPKRGQSARPRILLDLSHHGHTLSVLPLLVYGDPVLARVDAGNLVSVSGQVPKRNQPEERQLLEELRDELNLVPGRRVDFDGPEAHRFADKLRRWQSRTETAPASGIILEKPLVPRLVVDGDTVQLSFTVDAEAAAPGEPAASARNEASPEAVLKAFRDGLGVVPLSGGGWAPLPLDFLEQQGHLLADFLAARDKTGKVATAALPVLGKLCEALNQPPPPGLERLAPLFEGFESIPEASLPEGLTATLRPYQRAGVNWLCFLRHAELGAILADDMGLGKTLQALCALGGQSLVVCPKSLLFNWAREIERFLPGAKVCVYHGPKRQLDPEAQLTLTTYAVLRLDTDALSAISWDCAVLDEAQAIKNPESQGAQAAYALSARFRVALSGTPIENRLDELWSLFHFTNRGLLGGRADFQARYAEPIATGRPEAAARLHELVRPFVLRRLKRDVAPELPPRTDVVLYVELEEPERAVYDGIYAATKREVLDKLSLGGNVMQVLEALLRLRQAACHSALIPGVHADTSSKLELLMHELDESAADGHKALVFSQWTSLLDLVEPELRAKDIRFARLDGKTQNRGEVVEEFQSETGPPVLLSSLKAGGVGLNLTAADHVFLLDPWWNPAAEDQAADRAHRIGQEKSVMVYRVVAKDTVEERILELQERKRALAEAALSGTGQGAGLTREDLLALLS